MEQRKEFLGAAMRGEHSFTELCRRFGISRKNGYKWLNRYRIDLAFPAAPHAPPRARIAPVSSSGSGAD